MCVILEGNRYIRVPVQGQNYSGDGGVKSERQGEVASLKVVSGTEACLGGRTSPQELGRVPVSSIQYSGGNALPAYVSI